MRKHDVRMAVLMALTHTRVLSLDALTEDLDVQAAGASRAELLQELPGLVEHGYLVNHLAARRGHLYAITAAGRDQVRRDADLDEYVYGERAY